MGFKVLLLKINNFIYQMFDWEMGILTSTITQSSSRPGCNANEDVLYIPKLLN